MNCALNKKVVLLRSHEGILDGPDQYTEIIRSAGYDVHNVPTLSFQYEDLDLLKNVLDTPAAFSGLIFTSPRAVLAAGQANNGCQLDHGWRDKLCFVVGEKTSTMVQEVLGLSGIGGGSGNAENLADFIIKKIDRGSKPLLFPSGNLKKETVPMKLELAGINLQCTSVYVTFQHPELTPKLKKALEERPHFIVYFSPSGVKFSRDIIMKIEGLEHVGHVSIGPTTKAALESSGFKVCGSAQKPCPESVLEVLQAH